MNNFTRIKILENMKMILIALILGIGVSVVYASWVVPLGQPHVCTQGVSDCETPINVGPGISNNPQEKKGGLILGTSIPDTNTSLNVWSGKVGVGIPASTPASSIQDFDVQGELKADGLCIGDDCRTSWPVASDTGGSTGLVMAFDGQNCPTGWSIADSLSGRVVLGVGNNNTLESVEHVLGEQGGAYSIVQTASQVPPHYHSLPNQSFANSLNTDNDIKNCQGIDGCNNGINYAVNAGFYYPSIGNNSGGGAMNVMNPYVVLTYCKKD